MQKKILSLLLALLMLGGLLSVSAMAASGEMEAAALEADVPGTLDVASDGEGEVTPDTEEDGTEPSANTGTLTVTSSATSVKVGDEFTVTIAVEAEQIPVLVLSYKYDSSVFSLVGTEKNVESGLFLPTTTGCSWSAVLGITAGDLSGSFATLTFKALQEAETSEITVSAAGGKSYELISSNPTITFASQTVSVSITEDDGGGAVTGLLGDAYSDGEIDTEDARVIIDYIFSQSSDGIDLLVSDCYLNPDEQGEIDTEDARAIIDAIFGAKNGVGEDVVITGTYESGVGIWEFKELQ